MILRCFETASHLRDPHSNIADSATPSTLHRRLTKTPNSASSALTPTTHPRSKPPPSSTSSSISAQPVFTRPLRATSSRRAASSSYSVAPDAGSGRGQCELACDAGGGRGNSASGSIFRLRHGRPGVASAFELETLYTTDYEGRKRNAGRRYIYYR